MIWNDDLTRKTERKRLNDVQNTFRLPRFGRWNRFICWIFGRFFFFKLKTERLLFRLKSPDSMMNITYTATKTSWQRERERGLQKRSMEQSFLNTFERSFNTKGWKKASQRRSKHVFATKVWAEVKWFWKKIWHKRLSDVPNTSRLPGLWRENRFMWQITWRESKRKIRSMGQSFLTFKMILGEVLTWKTERKRLHDVSITYRLPRLERKIKFMCLHNFYSFVQSVSTNREYIMLPGMLQSYL